MVAEPVTFQRARSPEHKRQRYEAILAAARELGIRDGVRNVSLADIAAEVGVHKTALLRYFETREEIYLQIATENWRDWAAALRDELAEAPVGSVAPVAAAFARTLTDRPLLCDLLTHAPLNLERNVSLESVRTFKLAVLAAVEEIRKVVVRVLPQLDDTDFIDLISSTSLIAAGMWQICHPPPVLADLYEQDPLIGHAKVDFAPSVTRLTELILTGLQARAQSKP